MYLYSSENNSTMRFFLVLSAVFAVALSDDGTSAWQTLKARWGTPGTDGYFVDIPMTSDEALALNFQSIDVENELGLKSMVFNGNDPRIVPLYAAQGDLAGVQVAVPYEEIDTNRPASYNLENVPGFKRKTVLGVDSWTAAFYFYNPENIRAGQRTCPRLMPNFMCKMMGIKTTTLEKGLWFREGEGHIKVPTTVDEVGTSTLYTTQACIPSMGGHQYYDMSATTSCDTMPPFFLLTNNGNVSGVGFQIFGRVTDKTWHEAPSQAAVQAIVPRGPECLYDNVAEFGVVTTHFFFEDQPWLAVCS